MQDDPREQIDEADIGGEEGHDLGAAQDVQGVNVEIVGHDPQHAEEAAATEKFTWKK